MKPKAILLSSDVMLGDVINGKNKEDLLLIKGQKGPIFLSPDDLKLRLSSLSDKNLDPSSGNPLSEMEINGTGTLIVPLTKEWSAKTIEDSLLNFLIKEIQLDHENFKIYKEGKPILLPETGVTFAWRKFGKSIHAGKRIFPLDVFFEDKLIYSTPVSFLIEEKKEAWFTKREIDTKEIIQEYDVEKRKFFTSDNHTEYDLDSPIGKTALNDIPEGFPLQRKQTRRLHMIERGSEVGLVFTHGNIMVKVRTRALESGNEGDEISLLNLSSNRKLKGKVQSSGICLLEDL
ncbi:MAG: flagellar basal body P-ring formation chaperone FlgA [Leptospira sp.]|nr:flagellar basal body P-ring formation chaperone FlgA [Leptospira sp.]